MKSLFGNEEGFFMNKILLYLKIFLDLSKNKIR